MDYAYLNDLERRAERSTIETLLQTALEYDGDAQAILPFHPTSAIKVLKATQRVRTLLEHFVIAPKDLSMTDRVHCASAADQFEKTLEPTLGRDQAAAAANRFLLQVIGQ